MLQNSTIPFLLLFRWQLSSAHSLPIEYGFCERMPNRCCILELRTNQCFVCNILSVHRYIVLVRICCTETGLGFDGIRKPKIFFSEPKPVSMILENGQFQKSLMAGPRVPHNKRTQSIRWGGSNPSKQNILKRVKDGNIISSLFPMVGNQNGSFRRKVEFSKNGT